MISVTKILRFEAAHVINEYPGACGRIHGHSYELHITVKLASAVGGYIGGMGIIYDFKDLKKLVSTEVIEVLDHKLLVSKKYVGTTKIHLPPEEIVVFEAEPTAENLLIFINERLRGKMPDEVRLISLRLWETKDSYAELTPEW